MAGKKRRLSNYVRMNLPAKIRKIKEDHPGMDNKQAVAIAISMLKERENKKHSFAKDVNRMERKNR